MSLKVTKITKTTNIEPAEEEEIIEGEGTVPEIEEMRKGFELFDLQGKGRIQPKQLKETMEQMNLKDKHPVIYELICTLDTPEIEEKGGVTFDEYVAKVNERMSDRKTKEGIKRLFDFFNVDPFSRTIPFATFVKVAKELHEQTTEDELRDLLQKTGCAGDEITFDEFYEIMTKESYI
jgi:Ca2+-binding EF-hand superfamily protein